VTLCGENSRVSFFFFHPPLCDSKRHANGRLSSYVWLNSSSKEYFHSIVLFFKQILTIFSVVQLTMNPPSDDSKTGKSLDQISAEGLNFL
jgi:hypothetical protein